MHYSRSTPSIFWGLNSVKVVSCKGNLQCCQRQVWKSGVKYSTWLCWTLTEVSSYCRYETVLGLTFPSIFLKGPQKPPWPTNRWDIWTWGCLTPADETSKHFWKFQGKNFIEIVTLRGYGTPLIDLWWFLHFSQKLITHWYWKLCILLGQGIQLLY